MITKTDRIVNFVCGNKPNDVCVLTIHQLVKTMEQTCAQCQADRKYVLLDPQCKDRFYLSLLVEAGVPYSEYPQDCYKIRLEEIKKVLQGKPTPVPVVDAVIRLKDFIKIMAEVFKTGISKRKISSAKNADKLLEIVKEIATNINELNFWSWNRKAYITLKRENTIMVNLLNFSEDIAYINLYERPIKEENLQHIINHLFGVFGVNGNIYSSPTGNLYIRISININSKEIVSKLNEYKNLDLRITETKDKGYLITINVLSQGSSTIRYRELIEIIRSIGER